MSTTSEMPSMAVTIFYIIFRIFFFFFTVSVSTTQELPTQFDEMVRSPQEISPKLGNSHLKHFRNNTSGWRKKCIFDLEVNLRDKRHYHLRLCGLQLQDSSSASLNSCYSTLGTRTSLRCHLTTLAENPNKPSDSTETLWLSWSTQQSECIISRLSSSTSHVDAF